MKKDFKTNRDSLEFVDGVPYISSKKDYLILIKSYLEMVKNNTKDNIKPILKIIKK